MWSCPWSVAGITGSAVSGTGPLRTWRAPLRPLDLALQVECGHAHAAAGQWEKAVVQFEKITATGAASPAVWYWQALAQLGAGQPEKYRQTCQGMLDRFAKSAAAARMVVQAYRIAPDALPSSEPIIKLAEQTVAASRGDLQSLRLLGQALYRAGRHADAVKRVDEVMKRKAYAEQDLWFVPDALYVAMAHAQLGHRAEAEKWFSKALRRIDQAERDKPPAGAYIGPSADYWENRRMLGQTMFSRYGLDHRPWDAWYNRLVLRLLRQETETLLAQIDRSSK